MILMSSIFILKERWSSKTKSSNAPSSMLLILLRYKLRYVRLVKFLKVSLDIELISLLPG